MVSSTVAFSSVPPVTMAGLALSASPMPSVQSPASVDVQGDSPLSRFTCIVPLPST